MVMSIFTRAKTFFWSLIPVLFLSSSFFLFRSLYSSCGTHKWQELWLWLFLRVRRSLGRGRCPATCSLVAVETYPWSAGPGAGWACECRVGHRLARGVLSSLPFFFPPRSCLLRSWSFLSTPLCPLPVLPTHCGLCQLVSAAASTGPWNACGGHHGRACLGKNCILW